MQHNNSYKVESCLIFIFLKKNSGNFRFFLILWVKPTTPPLFPTISPSTCELIKELYDGTKSPTVLSHLIFSHFLASSGSPHANKVSSILNRTGSLVRHISAIWGVKNSLKRQAPTPSL